MATILIVEDDEALVAMLQIALEQMGHNIHACLNGLDALYEASSVQPDLVILDLMMPWASGDAVLGFIRATEGLKDVQVLVLSAHPNARQIAIQLEADDFLAKPVSIQTLRRHVARLLEPAEAAS